MFNVDLVKLFEKLHATYKDKSSSPPTCPGPKLIRFHAYLGADKSGRLDDLATDSYGSYNVVGCYGLYVQGKNAEDNEWHTIDEILDVIKWIADGWYEGENTWRFIAWDLDGDGTPITPTEPLETYTLEKRRVQVPAQTSEAFSELPRLIQFSTPNTYSSSALDAYMPIKIETRGDGDLQWDSSYGGADYWSDVLSWFQEGLYRVTDRQCQISCVFERN